MTQIVGRVPRGHVVRAEGKTKIIWVRIRKRKKRGLAQNKPFVTAGDGKHREFVTGKEIAVTETTCNIFRLLNRSGIPTHYHKKINADTYLISLLDMIPIEIVVRRKAFGSYLKRNSHEAEGTTFAQPLVEFFYKNDTMSDPMMIWQPEHQCFRLYHPHEPPEERGAIGDLKAGLDPLIPRNEAEIERLEVIAIEAFLVLEEAFKHVGITLVDFKIECGRLYEGDLMRIVLADEISPDSCRLWDVKTNEKLDKDRFRRDLGKVEEAYQEVARRLGILPEGGPRDMKGPDTVQ